MEDIKVVFWENYFEDQQKKGQYKWHFFYSFGSSEFRG